MHFASKMPDGVKSYGRAISEPVWKIGHRTIRANICGTVDTGKMSMDAHFATLYPVPLIIF
jgi:hypothetical protein